MPDPPGSVGQALRRAAAALAQAGIEEPGREARLLMAHALSQPRSAPLDPRSPAPPGFHALVSRRAAREPAAYIVGQAGFWTLELDVDRSTLIPRADSETLIEAALAHRLDRARVRRVLDLGTGTGALLLAALQEFPAATGIGVDRAPAACTLARRNAQRNGLAARASFACASWADALDGRFDVVLANPPYVARWEMPGLAPEVRAHEPESALDGGPDGLDAYRAIVPELPRLLGPGGIALLELGAGQSGAVLALAVATGHFETEVVRDLAAIERVLVLSAREEKCLASGPRRL